MFQPCYICAVCRIVRLRRRDICFRCNIGNPRVIGLYYLVYTLLRDGMFFAQWPVAFLGEMHKPGIYFGLFERRPSLLKRDL